MVISGDPGRDPADALDGGLDLDEIGHRLDPDEVDASGDERGRLLGKDVDGFFVLEGSGRGHDRAGRADVSGDESRRAAAVHRIHLGAEEDRRRLVQFGHPRVQIVQSETKPVATERVRHDDPRTGVEIAAVDPPDRPPAGSGSRPRAGRRTGAPTRTASCPSPRRRGPCRPRRGPRGSARSPRRRRSARLVAASGKADGSTGPRSSGSAVRAGRRVRIVMAGMIAGVARVSGRPIRDELAIQPLPGVLPRPDEVRPAVPDGDLGRDRDATGRAASTR